MTDQGSDKAVDAVDDVDADDTADRFDDVDVRNAATRVDAADGPDGADAPASLNPFRRLWVWLHSPSPPPKPDATVEVAWLPLWQAQLVLHELWQREIPSVMSEDHSSHLRFGAREPMARIFVIAARAKLATEVIEDVIGEPPIGMSH
jgi:hypothetical protein